jgi:hypothetical protein
MQRSSLCAVSSPYRTIRGLPPSPPPGDLGHVRVLVVGRADVDDDPLVVLGAGDVERLGVGRIERAARPYQEEAWPAGKAVLAGAVGLREERDDLRVDARLGEELVQGENLG